MRQITIRRSVELQLAGSGQLVTRLENTNARLTQERDAALREVAVMRVQLADEHTLLTNTSHQAQTLSLTVTSLQAMMPLLIAMMQGRDQYIVTLRGTMRNMLNTYVGNDAPMAPMPDLGNPYMVVPGAAPGTAVMAAPVPVLGVMNPTMAPAAMPLAPANQAMPAIGPVPQNMPQPAMVDQDSGLEDLWDQEVLDEVIIL